MRPPSELRRIANVRDAVRRDAWTRPPVEAPPPGVTDADPAEVVVLTSTHPVPAHVEDEQAAATSRTVQLPPNGGRLEQISSSQVRV